MIEILNIDDYQILILFTNSFINDKFIYILITYDFVISINTSYHYKWNKARLLIINKKCWLHPLLFHF